MKMSARAMLWAVCLVLYAWLGCCNAHRVDQSSSSLKDSPAVIPINARASSMLKPSKTSSFVERPDRLDNAAEFGPLRYAKMQRQRQERLEALQAEARRNGQFEPLNISPKDSRLRYRPEPVLRRPSVTSQVIKDSLHLDHPVLGRTKLNYHGVMRGQGQIFSLDDVHFGVQRMACVPIGGDAAHPQYEIVLHMKMPGFSPASTSGNTNRATSSPSESGQSPTSLFDINDVGFQAGDVILMDANWRCGQTQGRRTKGQASRRHSPVDLAVDGIAFRVERLWLVHQSTHNADAADLQSASLQTQEVRVLARQESVSSVVPYISVNFHYTPADDADPHREGGASYTWANKSADGTAGGKRHMR